EAAPGRRRGRAGPARALGKRDLRRRRRVFALRRAARGGNPGRRDDPVSLARFALCAAGRERSRGAGLLGPAELRDAGWGKPTTDSHSIVKREASRSTDRARHVYRGEGKTARYDREVNVGTRSQEAP